MNRLMKHYRMIVLLAAVWALGPIPFFVSGCSDAAKRAPVLVAQTGVALADSVGAISKATEQLEKASVLPAAAALSVQEGLLKANTSLKPLPDILRTIDAAQKAGDSASTDVEKAIAILKVVAPDISVLLAGVPITEGTKALIELVRAAQGTVTTVLLEVARLREGS